MRKLLLSLAVLAFVSAAPAGAATYSVYAGEQSRKGAPPEATQNRFMPGTVTVHAGDKVTFQSNSGVHTVSFLGRANPADFAFIAADPAGSTYAGVKDAAGNDFHFNGLTKWIFNLQVVFPQGSTKVADRKIHSRGVGKDVGAAKVTFSFPKTGTYGYVCLIHPGMKGKVVVRPKGAPVATPAAVTRKAKSQEQAGWAAAKKLEKTTVPANTIYAGLEQRGVHLFALLPQQLTVKAGTPITVVGKGVSDAHNVGVGPQDWIKTFLNQTEFFPESPTGPNQISPVHVYGSDPGPLVYDGTNHGNGFVTTRALDSSRLTPIPSTAQITFTKPGTYTAYCLVHFPDMKMTITVTP